MDWPSVPEEKNHSYLPHQCPSKLLPREDSLRAFQGCATSCLLVSVPFPSISGKGTCCRDITTNRSQANRRIKLTQLCQTCVARELIRFAEGSAYKCKPSTICRKLVCLADIVYSLHKAKPCIVWLDHWVSVGYLGMSSFCFHLFLFYMQPFSALHPESWDFSVVFNIFLCKCGDRWQSMNSLFTWLQAVKTAHFRGPSLDCQWLKVLEEVATSAAVFSFYEQYIQSDRCTVHYFTS